MTLGQSLHLHYCGLASSSTVAVCTKKKKKIASAKTSGCNDQLLTEQNNTVMTNRAKIRPAKRLMNAAGGCAKYGTEYGNCVLLKYQTIKKGDCEQEFQKFKSCVTEKLAKK